jgi:hypothetical protein
MAYPDPSSGERPVLASGPQQIFHVVDKSVSQPTEPSTLSRIATVERVDVATLRADRRARATAYADPPPARLHLSERDLRDAGEAGKALLREARAIGMQPTVGS